MSTLNARIRARRGTSAAWAAANPILTAGEFGYETDTNKGKYGNGVDVYSARPYYGGADINEVINGGTVTVGTFGGAGVDNDIRVAPAIWYIVGFGTFSTAINTDFLDIALAAAGKQRFVDIYGKGDGSIVKVEGVEAAIAAHPAPPADSIIMGSVLVSDAGLGSSPDLSGLLPKADKATQSTVLIGTNDTTYLTPLANARDLKVVAKDYSTSSVLTGTTTETKIGNSILISAGTFNVGDGFKLRAWCGSRFASGASHIKFWINTSDSLSGATVLGWYSAAAIFFPLERNFFIKSLSDTRGSYGQTENTQINDFAQNGGNSNSYAGSTFAGLNWQTTAFYLITSFKNSVVGAESTRLMFDVIKL